MALPCNTTLGFENVIWSSSDEYVYILVVCFHLPSTLAHMPTLTRLHYIYAEKSRPTCHNLSLKLLMRKVTCMFPVSNIVSNMLSFTTKKTWSSGKIHRKVGISIPNKIQLDDYLYEYKLGHLCWKDRISMRQCRWKCLQTLCIV